MTDRGTQKTFGVLRFAAAFFVAVIYVVLARGGY